MDCLVCFDVKKEDAELKKGHKGIGVCQQWDTSDVANPKVYMYDGNFFGTVEAQSDSAFRFAEDAKNDWDIDSGYLGDTSSMGGMGDIGGQFVSEPLDVNSNSPRNLGI